MSEYDDFPEMTDEEIEQAAIEADAAAWRAMEDAADLRTMQCRSPAETSDSLADLAPPGALWA